MLANDEGDSDALPNSFDYGHLSEQLFPSGNETMQETTMSALLANLPERLRAWSLCETYIEHAGWMFRPLLREEIVNDVLTPIYKLVQEATPDEPASISPHKLAVLYLIFAMGALLDLTLEPSQ